jgi:uncharacterized protein YqcC (DUF446 family)
MSHAQKVQSILTRLQSEMLKHNLWQIEPISSDAMNSTQPFSFDTMSPEQWLQFILIPKLTHLITADSPMPNQFEITPYFEQTLSDKIKQHTQLIKIIKQLDDILNA